MQDYLLRFMPLLTEALTEMTMRRPQDPTAYLAQFLLARSNYPQSEDVCASILEHAGATAQHPDDEALIESAARMGLGSEEGAKQQSQQQKQSSRPSSASRSASVAPARAPSSKQGLRLIVAGAPCSGKGTQCEWIKEEFGVVHLSTGDLLRAEIAAGSELGLQAQGYMERGLLLPDELMIGVVAARLQQPEVQRRGFLLDGFPRTAAQARALHVAGIHADCFLQLHVPDAAVVQRVVGRRLDPQTGRTFHVQFDPPPSDDEDLLARLVQRPDDSEEKIATRLQAYHAAIQAIKDQYADVAVDIDGDRPKQRVTEDIKRALEELVQKLGRE